MLINTRLAASQSSKQHHHIPCFLILKSSVSLNQHTQQMTSQKLSQSLCAHAHSRCTLLFVTSQYQTCQFTFTCGWMLYHHVLFVSNGNFLISWPLLSCDDRVLLFENSQRGAGVDGSGIHCVWGYNCTVCCINRKRTRHLGQLFHQVRSNITLYY